MFMEKIEKILKRGTEIIDITQKLNRDTPVWTGDRPFRLKQEQRVSRGDGYDLSSIEMSLHAGTHIDFPRHLIASGRSSTDYTDMKRFILTVRVDDPFVDGEIDCRHIPVRSTGIDGLLLKGGKSWLSQCAARLVTEYGYSLVGVESMGVDDPDSEFFPSHRALLTNDVLIIENLDLSKVEAGVYNLIALPMKIDRAEAAPIRCLLLR